MLSLLAAVIATPIQTERLLYYCKGTDSLVEFSLAYERRASRISKVRIVHRDSPRLPPDEITRWRGRTTEQGAVFTLNTKPNGVWTSGEMTLVSSTEPNRFRLTWSSVIGAKGSHIPLGTPEQRADCVLAEKAFAA